MKTIVCTLIAAALFFVSAGLIGFWPAAWLAPAPILWLAYSGARRREVFAASFIAYALGQASLFAAYSDLIPLPLLALNIAMLSLLFTASVFLGWFAVSRLPAFIGVLAFPAALTAIDFLSSLVSPNGTFGSLAYSQVGLPMAIQSAAFFGMWSITFLIGLVASLVALAAARGAKPAGIAAGAFAVLVFAANLGFGYMQLHTPIDAGMRVERVGLAAEDSLTHDGFADDAAATARVTAAYADAVNVLAGRGATTVVLPEKIAILRPAWREAALEPLKSVATQTGVRIVAGFEERGAELRNVALTLNPGGTVSSYFKRHMVPGVEHHVPGAGPGLLGNGFAVAICKDMDFPATIRADAQNKIGLMFVPAWDFGADGWLHARMAILRGVENGFAIVRAAKNGILTVSDAQGRVLASAPSDRHALVTVIADVPVGKGGTLYTRIGDVFGWAALGLILVLTIGALARPRGKSRQAK